MSIMAKQAAAQATTAERRKELYDLYLRRHDRIDNWDLVDLAAWYVVGAWLVDKPRDVLYELARSGNIWERRTAILATLLFIRRGELDDTLPIAEILLEDPQDLIHKAVGGMLREAGEQDRPRLLAFLDKHAATMPRTMLRYAIEHFDPEQRAHYLGLALAVVPKHVVHPVLLGGWWFSKPQSQGGYRMKLHANAALTLRQRRRMVRLVVEQGWSLAAAGGRGQHIARTLLEVGGSLPPRPGRAAGPFLGAWGWPTAPPSDGPGDRGAAQVALHRPEIAELSTCRVSTISGMLTRVGIGKLGRLGLEPANATNALGRAS